MDSRVLKFIVAATLFVGLFALSPAAAQTGSGFNEHWPWGSIAEVDERGAAIGAVKAAFDLEDFGKLDALETEFGGDRGFTTSGSSKLPLYYEELAYLIGGPPHPEKCNTGQSEFLDRWRKSSPRAPAPIILSAKLLIYRAWCFRGSDRAGSVPQDAWQPFHENLNAAASVLEKYKALASLDPEYYSVLEVIYVGQSRSRSEFKQVTDEGSARYPYYHDIYYSAVDYYKPRWFGRPGDVDALASYAIEKTKGRDGTGGYFRVYWDLALCKCLDDLETIDWPTMQTAMTDLSVRYPTDWTYLHLVQLSCLRGQASEAKKYFSKMTINQAGSWSRDDWIQCRALVGAPQEPIPDVMN